MNMPITLRRHGDYGKLRQLYASLSGMNFREIEAYRA